MLFESYSEKGLICQKNVWGEVSAGTFAFRGDMVVELGDMHESSQTRNPPKQILIQATCLSKDEKIVFMGGMLDRVEQIEDLFDMYGADLADDAKLVLYIVNADTNYTTEFSGKTINVVPFDEGTIWNLLMEDFYVEKSDLKGQSGEEKVETLVDAYGEFDKQGDTISFDDALANATDAVREARGPV